MKNLHSADIVMQPGRSVTWETTAGTDSQPLEVNVIFTELQATAAALKSAESLARGLGASIRLRAAIVVPLRLPLDQSPVSVPFMEQLLSELVSQSESDAFEHTVHLYICRDGIETLLHVLRPNSLVVIGGRRRWWPTAAARMARRLRANGHRVAFVDFTKQTTGSLP
jgi:hypothetical protein